MEPQEFELLLHYYFRFRTYTLGKRMISYSSSYGLNSTTTVLIKDGFGIK